MRVPRLLSWTEMPAAVIPVDEQRRLDALDRIAILDTSPEPFFEDVVDAVAEVIAAPIILISLVDQHRQWFKARRGLDVTETPRDLAFCAHAILNEGPLIVSDCANDIRFKDNALVNGAPHIGAYVGSPIVLECGARLGTLCAIDTVSRHWGEKEIAHLERCARMVARHLDARRSHIERNRHTFLERVLSRTETRYKSLIDVMSEGMVVQGPSGAIVDYNAAACVILGLTDQELLGRTSTDKRWRPVTQTGEDFPGEQHPAMVCLRTGIPQYDVPIGIETPNGERRWLRVSSYPVRDDRSDRVQQVISVFKQD
jgi:PAS domain S-box-containing protein